MLHTLTLEAIAITMQNRLAGWNNEPEDSDAETVDMEEDTMLPGAIDEPYWSEDEDDEW